MSNFTKAYKNAAECIGTSILISFILFYIMTMIRVGLSLSIYLSILLSLVIRSGVEYYQARKNKTQINMTDIFWSFMGCILVLSWFNIIMVIIK